MNRTLFSARMLETQRWSALTPRALSGCVQASALRSVRSTSNNMNQAETDPGKTPDHIPRLRLILGAFAAALLVLVAGLGYQQLFRRADHSAHEQRQNQRRVLTPAPRGIIHDREHRILAGNRVRVAAVLHLGDLREEFRQEQSALFLHGKTTAVAAEARRIVVQRHLDRVNTLIGRQAQVDSVKLERAFARERMAPFVLVDDLTESESERLTSGLAASNPVRLRHATQRWFPHGGTAAHVVGRVRREAMRTAGIGYMGFAGDSGIEKQYNSGLQGRPGEALVRVDAWGFPLDPPLARRESTPGENVVLSLDLDLQIAAERAMDAIRGRPNGAVAVIAVDTGEVLALASQPGFDLNAVSPVLSPETKQRIDAEGGWFNRATQGLYPPGSTFKIFTAAAGLRSGALDSDTKLHCSGFHEIGGHRFVCHTAAGHGDLALREALARSCNVFAYQTGLAAGPDALAGEARRFHLGEPTGINLPGETSRMLVPDEAWKLEHEHETWTPGDTINLSIGQGFLRCSPLQMACAIASLARRETLTVPSLLHQPGRSPTGGRAAEPLGLTDDDYAALIAGLRAVIETGIGRDAQVPGVAIAGKTGTAQVTRPKGTFNVAWFVAFAPVEHPEIAIAVTLEGDQPGVEFAGAEHAAPIVREVFGTYFEKKRNGVR
jgi:penicillin-binding protein 2